jgi:hypothetical protein
MDGDGVPILRNLFVQMLISSPARQTHREYRDRLDVLLTLMVIASMDRYKLAQRSRVHAAGRPAGLYVFYFVYIHT